LIYSVRSCRDCIRSTETRGTSSGPESSDMTGLDVRLSRLPSVFVRFKSASRAEADGSLHKGEFAARLESQTGENHALVPQGEGPLSGVSAILRCAARLRTRLALTSQPRNSMLACAAAPGPRAVRAILHADTLGDEMQRFRGCAPKRSAARGRAGNCARSHDRVQRKRRRQAEGEILHSPWRGPCTGPLRVGFTHLQMKVVQSSPRRGLARI